MKGLRHLILIMILLALLLAACQTDTEDPSEPTAVSEVEEPEAEEPEAEEPEAEEPETE